MGHLGGSAFSATPIFVPNWETFGLQSPNLVFSTQPALAAERTRNIDVAQTYIDKTLRRDFYPS